MEDACLQNLYLLEFKLVGDKKRGSLTKRQKIKMNSCSAILYSSEKEKKNLISKFQKDLSLKTQKMKDNYYGTPVNLDS